MPPGSNYSLEIGGETRQMCCPGCRAVAGLIADSGLERFYDQRSAYNLRPDEQTVADRDEYRIYDDPALSAQFCEPLENGEQAARLLIGGVTCAACTWLIERTLSQHPAVSAASMNLTQSRLDLRFDATALPVSELFARIAALGYSVKPWHSSSQRQQAQAEYRQDLRRLAVAGIGMMQVGMFAIALHAGDLQGISEEYRALLRWFSLLVTAFIIGFSGRGFFISAWRHLRVGALVMDLPVALAIGLAWCASAVATIGNTGDVYFDSVIMFTFLLLLARFVEKRLRYRDALEWQDAESLLPVAVTQWQDGRWQTLPRRNLGGGERLLLRVGEVIPIDGEVTEGSSAVREDSFNGEALPRPVSAGDTVFAGTLNLDAPLQIHATGGYAQTRLAALQRSIDSAQLHKPALARLADRIAGYFIAAVLLLTATTALLWWQIDPQQTFWISLSVLVISCPCALSLATPSCLANAAAALRSSAVIVHGENALETLARADHLMFDKTGTLTSGRLRLESVRVLDSSWSEDRLRAAGAALQRYSNHPIAGAFAHIPASDAITEVRQVVGAGLEGSLDGRQLRMGAPDFCRELSAALPAAPPESLYWVAMVCDDGPLGWFGFSDETRPEAPALLAELRTAGAQLALLTGDPSARAAEVGRELGFDEIATGLTPQEKLQRVATLQQQGKTVAMIGDGLNDAPVLSLADVSVAVTGASDLARAQADFVILEGDLSQIALLRRTALRTRRIILENFAWAIGYNAVGIPLAMFGMVPPWAAAIGMSLSSLLVVGNAMRLRRTTARPAPAD